MFPELTQRLHGVTMQVLRHLPHVQCTVQCALCKIENCVQCAVVCALRNIHLASVTIRYVFINWVVTLLRPRPSGPNRAELYSSGILRTQTFFLEGVYFMVYMARHDVGAQAYRHQSRTVFSSGIVRIFKLFVLEGVQSFRHPSPIPTRKIELEPGCSFQVDCAR